MSSIIIALIWAVVILCFLSATFMFLWTVVPWDGVGGPEYDETPHGRFYNYGRFYWDGWPWMHTAPIWLILIGLGVSALHGTTTIEMFSLGFWLYTVPMWLTLLVLCLARLGDD